MSDALRQLLVICWQMPPLLGPRSLQVSRTLRQLVRLGWRSTVICVDPRPGGPLLRDAPGLAEHPGDGVVLERIPSLEESFPLRAAWRLCPPLGKLPDRQRVWVGPAVRLATRLASHTRYDAMISFAKPWSAHLVARALHRRLELPWSAHFSDPWLDSPYEQPDPLVLPSWRRWERSIVQEANAVMFVNRYTADAVMAKYPDDWRHKVHIIPQGYEPEVLARVTFDHPPRPRLRLVYTGRFYDGMRTPLPLFDALAQINARRNLDADLEVRLVGPFMKPYAAEAESRGLGSIVTFTGHLPYLDSLQEAAHADALLMIEAARPVPNLFLPSKLVDYLPLRKPIVGLTPLEGASADLLRQLECPVVGPDDVKGIERVIEQTIERWRQRRLVVSPRFDRVAETYDIAKTTQLVASILERQLVGAG